MMREIVTKPLEFVLMITMHMAVTGQADQAEVTGILGQNVTLQFRFNQTIITKTSHFAVYKTGPKKMAEWFPQKGCSTGFSIYLDNSSALYQITNLTHGHTGTYWATLFTKSGPARRSSSVRLLVLEENRPDTISHVEENRQTTKHTPRTSHLPFSGPVIAIFVVSLVVVFAAVFPCLFWCCVRTRGTKDGAIFRADVNADGNSQPSTQAPPEPTFVYSLLDFPKRLPTPLKDKPTLTARRRDGVGAGAKAQARTTEKKTIAGKQLRDLLKNKTIL
ncbi:uncharacterized protein LOC133540619 isoform X2 [Nerophis ophidion]|uniref:uncharacterized protein LOC133540619 isoform X2 n=1 Tax=Nerophis ophidion TaxID=159077 RepID=UPI002ADF6C62|nr:uncharacterized protein LOC133540619 isoform X2 [Nerophis ophidion]